MRLEDLSSAEPTFDSLTPQSLLEDALKLGIELLECFSGELYWLQDEFEEQWKHLIQGKGLAAKSTLIYQPDSNDAFSFQQLEVLEKSVAMPLLSKQNERIGFLVFSSEQPIDWNDEKAMMMKTLGELITTVLLSQKTEKLLFLNSRLSTLGQMAIEITHEINNPVTSIQAGLALLKIRVNKPGFVIEQLNDHLSKMEAVAERLAAIVKNVKGFVCTPEKTKVDSVVVGDLINESISYCFERSKEFSVQILLDDVHSNLKVSCNKVQVSQVLVNLMNNSIDAVTGSHQPWLKLVTESDEPWVKIKVIDSGNGISEKLLKRLFEPFFTTKNTNGGTGLGLSISRKIIEANEGLLEYTETDGHTTFVVRLPKLVQQG